ncbi:hypothetical protein [Paenibacillus naphthalenovorans]|uniref:hypothetical protein n=1 Tax=Paenibacillus naphthalenovorans TaxID=162209 RepID=UPI003D2E0C41
MLFTVSEEGQLKRGCIGGISKEGRKSLEKMLKTSPFQGNINNKLPWGRDYVAAAAFTGLDEARAGRAF